MTSTPNMSFLSPITPRSRLKLESVPKEFDPLAVLNTPLKDEDSDLYNDPSTTSGTGIANTAENTVKNNNSSNKASYLSVTKMKAPLVENLTIRVSDEAKIMSAIRDASKFNTTGAIFSVRIHLANSDSIGIGVKDLNDSLLTVSLLKRLNGIIGAGELGGLRLGDIIFGLSFKPTREGSVSLVNALKSELAQKKKYLHLQCWRCYQLCEEQVPGIVIPPNIHEMFISSYSLYRNGILTESERWNFIAILLNYMFEYVKCTRRKISSKPSTPANVSSESLIESSNGKLNYTNTSDVLSRILLVVNSDFERNILQAKGLRSTICVRIVYTKKQQETTIYVLRVEDVESGMQWVVHRSSKDILDLYETLIDMNSSLKDIHFPKKSIFSRNSSKNTENRIVSIELFIRRAIQRLTESAPFDSLSSRSLKYIQIFLSTNKYIDCLSPPPVDQQRFIEIMAYKYLNDSHSPACDKCSYFVSNIDLDSLINVSDSLNGYKPVLVYISQALAEVESFVLEHHLHHMSVSLHDCNPNMDDEARRIFVRKCVRRQVEASVYLPLRRSIFRIVYSYLASNAQQLQRALLVLQGADLEFFNIDPYVLATKSLSKAINAFRELLVAYLPVDQGQLLMQAASAVVELHSECLEYRKSCVAAKNSSIDVVSQNSLLTPNSKLTSNDDLLVNSQGSIKNSQNTVGRIFSALSRQISINSNIDMDDEYNVPSTPQTTSITTMDLTDKVVLADPIGEMFAVDETASIPDVSRKSGTSKISQDLTASVEDESTNGIDDSSESVTERSSLASEDNDYQSMVINEKTINQVALLVGTISLESDDAFDKNSPFNVNKLSKLDIELSRSNSIRNINMKVDLKSIENESIRETPSQSSTFEMNQEIRQSEESSRKVSVLYRIVLKIVTIKYHLEK